MEKEFVNVCLSCGKPIYCHNGFLEGVIQEDGTLICFTCENKSEELTFD